MRFVCCLWFSLPPQVVEIATYTEHVLTECEAKSNFGKCPRCTEAIPRVELDQHIADKTCNRESQGCLLCCCGCCCCCWNSSGDVVQLVRASDRHAADAGSIPWCGKGFFSQSQLSVQTLLHVSVHPRLQSHAHICAHVKDSVVHSMSELGGLWKH